MMATRLPAFASRAASGEPAWPVPMTMASKRVVCMKASVAGLDGRGDRCDHARCHPELRVAIPDAMAMRNPAEVGIDGPHVALVVLLHEEAHRPVQPGLRVRRDELRSESRIPEG